MCALFALGALPLAVGCMTAEEGAALQRDVQRLKDELAAQRNQANEARERLKAIMEQATGLLTRNSADVGAQVERLEQQLAKLSGAVEQAKNSVDEANKRLSALEGRVQPNTTPVTDNAKRDEIPTDKAELFALGSRNITNGEHEAGRRLMRHFVARFPHDTRAAEAQLLLGESYYAQQKFAPAIQEYRKVVELYKDSRQVPDALYKIGMAFYQLKFCSDAEVFLNELVKTHTRHPSVKKANGVLKLIHRFRKNRRVCTS